MYLAFFLVTSNRLFLFPASAHSLSLYFLRNRAQFHVKMRRKKLGNLQQNTFNDFFRTVIAAIIGNYITLQNLGNTEEHFISEANRAAYYEVLPMYQALFTWSFSHLIGVLKDQPVLV